MSWVCSQVGDERVYVDVPEVVGKQRPRAAVRGGRARVYTPRRTREFEERVRGAWLDQVGSKWSGFDGPVSVTVYVERELAKSNPKRWAGRKDACKPDIDNVAKAVLDALGGIAYADDSQVCRLTVDKLPRTPHGSGSNVFVRCSYYEETFVKEEKR